MAESQAQAPADAPSQTKPPIPTGVWIVVAMLLFFTIAFANLMVWVFFMNKPENIKRQGESGLMILGSAPEFSLLDQNGRTVTRADMNGKIWIVNFVFTRCAGPCPTMSGNMSTIQEKLKRRHALTGILRLVSFTVDPDWDSPDRLLEYASQYNADPEDWSFLTGPFDEIQRIAREGFKIGVNPADPAGNEPVIHGMSFVLVDGKGQIRGYYDGTNGSEISNLFEDAQRLKKELESR